MKLYNGMSPNGARVQIYLAEKEIEITTENVDILAGETRTAAFRQINSLGQVPVLELDDGTRITESVAICRYLETLHPKPPLFGESATEQAQVEMWNRRIERHIFDTVGNVGMHEMPLFADQIEQFPEYAASLRRRFGEKLQWLDGELSDGRAFVSGDSFSIADITGMASLMICQIIDQAIPESVSHVNRWADKMRSRPTWPMG
ncbi:MAG: glutathione S-transferase family protein [Hyphomicrobiaceae bacterium]